MEPPLPDARNLANWLKGGKWENLNGYCSRRLGRRARMQPIMATLQAEWAPPGSQNRAPKTGCAILRARSFALAPIVHGMFPCLPPKHPVCAWNGSMCSWDVSVCTQHHSVLDPNIPWQMQKCKMETHQTKQGPSHADKEPLCSPRRHGR